MWGRSCVVDGTDMGTHDSEAIEAAVKSVRATRLARNQGFYPKPKWGVRTPQKEIDSCGGREMPR
jgi:hypothetical protein